MDNYKQKLFDSLQAYNADEKEKILKAFDLASDAHFNQYRCSGEPYIVHPLSVAKTLIEMNADSDTVCAGLLHDTVEDTKITLDDISSEFNSDIANIVDGVTKMSKFKFSNAQEQNLANTRKIITSIIKDIRIIIVKLSDRLHNMNTLDFKSPEKQKKISFETLHIFAPIANSIGAYKIKNELEDLSLKYLEPDMYSRILYDKENFIVNNKQLIDDVSLEIKSKLSNNNIPCEIRQRLKSIYSVYNKIIEGVDYNSINDKLSLTIIVNEIIDCYDALYYIHQMYNAINHDFRDYITRPSINKYKSIHSNVFVRNNTVLQTQIRTNEMDKVDNMGLCAYWDLYGHKAHEKMQEDLKKDYPFFSTLCNFDKRYSDDYEFMLHTEAELLSSKIIVYNSYGEVVELPYGSTVQKYLYNQNIDINNVESIIVNENEVSLNHILKDNDVIFLHLKKGQALRLIKKD